MKYLLLLFLLPLGCWGQSCTDTVVAHGATGNGSTDDTAAIQATINANTTVGSVVCFPVGKYRVTQTLTIKPGVLYLGQGTYTINKILNLTVRSINTTNPISGTFAEIDKTGGIIFNISNLSTTNTTEVKNIVFNGATAANVFGTGGVRFNFTHNFIEHLTSSAINGVDTCGGPNQNCWIKNSTWDGNTLFDIWVGGSANANPHAALWCSEDGGPTACGRGFTFYGIENVTLSNNWFDSISNDGVHQWSDNNPFRASGNQLLDNECNNINRICEEIQECNSSTCINSANTSHGWSNFNIRRNFNHTPWEPNFGWFGQSYPTGGDSNRTYPNNNTLYNNTIMVEIGCCYISGQSAHNGLGYEWWDNNSFAKWNYSLATHRKETWDVGGFNGWQSIALGFGGGNLVQDNKACGLDANVPNAFDPQSPASTFLYNYGPGAGFPCKFDTDNNFYDSHLTLNWTSPTDNLTLSGTNNFNIYAISELSINWVKFYIDSTSNSPVVTQEIANDSTTFGSDARQPYTGSINLSSLPNGNHTIIAVATDITGRTFQATKPFNINGGTTVPAPTISSFTANPTSIQVGNSSTLSWVTTNATSVSISPTVGSGLSNSGSTSVSPTSTTIYTITATNTTGSATGTVTVGVTQALAPQVTGFSVSPSTISSGANATLTWSTQNATTVTISNGIGTVAVSGSQIVNPTATTVYTITATNTTGTVTANTTLTVTPVGSLVPVINSFTALPNPLLQGNAATLTWSTANGQTINISPGVGAVGASGTTTVSPTTSTTYIITVTNPTSTPPTVTQSINLVVNPVVIPPGTKKTLDGKARLDGQGSLY